MADYVAITDSQVDPDAPLTSELAYAWRDNLIAVTEGAVGAPRIQDAAMGSTVTNAGRDWVRLRMAIATNGSIGTVALLKFTGTAQIIFGGLVNGSQLTPSNATGENATGAPAVTGTWMCLGHLPPGSGGTGTNPAQATLFMRVS